MFEELLAGEPRLRVAPGTTPKLGLICFQLTRGGEAEAEALLEAINATGGWGSGRAGQGARDAGSVSMPLVTHPCAHHLALQAAPFWCTPS